MLFSPPCEYAIRALTYLAGQESGKPTSVAIIASNAGVPSQFLSKILLTLKKSGILKATKGPGGGYYLSLPPTQITLGDIANAIDKPSENGERCVLGLDLCRDDHPCPLHNEWKLFKAEVDTKINNLSIQELYEKLEEKRAHIKI